MRCPVDNETLVMADRNGVEIDYCPKCRGVWLDRGELDKIIEKASGNLPAAAPIAAPPQQPVHLQQPQRNDRGYDDRGRERRDDDDYRDGYKRKKRDSFLGELFDF